MKQSPSPVYRGTHQADRDASAAQEAGAGAPPRTLFPEDDGDRRRWRVRPAELARMLGTSKQSISRAIRDGKIVLGADGKVNPEQATAQYLRYSDPTRLRARLLAPLVRDLQAAQAREASARAEIERLRGELVDSEDEAAFHETASMEFLEQLSTVVLAVRDLWEELADLDPAARAGLLESMPEAVSERWHILGPMTPPERSTTLGECFSRLLGAPADADDLLDSMEPPTAPIPSTGGARDENTLPKEDRHD